MGGFATETPEDQAAGGVGDDVKSYTHVSEARHGAPGTGRAARYFGMTQNATKDKFLQKQRGNRGSTPFADREITWQPHVSRQDNYHPLRRLMLCLLILDDMIRQNAEVETGL
ncbi:MAG: hypothetical protein ABI164_03290 [Acidobacteriaceae bacterium]